jgi:hypothetical protein
VPAPIEHLGGATGDYRERLLDWQNGVVQYVEKLRSELKLGTLSEMNLPMRGEIPLRRAKST